MKREFSILVAFGILLAVLAIRAPAFFSAGNLRDIILTNAPVLLLAAGMTAVILAGQIDISIGAQFAVCSVLCGLLAKMGMPALLLVPATALIGGILGVANGALVAGLRIPSIVATLAAMVILRDSLRWSTGGAWVRDLPSSFQWFGLGQSRGEFVLVLTALFLFASLAWAFRNLAAGRAIYATGSDAEAARLAGLPVRPVLFGVFVTMGMLSGIATLLNSIRFSDLQSNAGIGLELKAIAAVVVGGASINGGRGTLLGTLLGVTLLGAIGPALTFLGVNSYWEKALQGAIILAAVAGDAVWSRTGVHGRQKFTRSPV